MSSAAYNCLIFLTNLGIVANRVEPDQGGPRSDCSCRSSLIWVHTVCHRGLLNISAEDKKQTTFVAIDALRVKDLNENF